MLREVTVGGDRLIPLPFGSALIASKSDPGAWHSVRLDHCSCRGWAIRGYCRHQRALASYLGTDHVEAVDRSHGVDDGVVVSLTDWREQRTAGREW